MPSPIVPPKHDLNMPHDFRFNDMDRRGCPPNCPYRIWSELREHYPEPVVDRSTETEGDWKLLTHRAARDFLERCCVTPTPDAIEQLAEVFLPCLQIMCDPAHPWDPRGGTWRKSGIFGALTDAKKKWERFWERTWKHGKRHNDSGFDLINFVGFVMRSDPRSGWGDWGPPGVPEEERLTAEIEDTFDIPEGLRSYWQEIRSVLPHPAMPYPPDENGVSLLPYRGLIDYDHKPSGEYPPPPARGTYPHTTEEERRFDDDGA